MTDRSSFTWKDGEWFEGNQPMLGPMSHAWWMASSVFDGARCFQRLAPDLDRHCSRLVESGNAFNMVCPVPTEEIVALSWDGIEKFPEDAELYIRPMMYFEDGFVAPDTGSTNFILTVFEAPMPPWGGVTTMLSSFRRPTPEAAPTNAKASCLYPNVGRALAEARGRGYGTAIVLDALGNVAEFATNNLFIGTGSLVETPVPNGSFLCGLTRKRIIELLLSDGYEVEERTMTMDDVYAADEVFLTGNYSKIQPVVQVEDARYQIGPVATRARELYFDFAKQKGGKKI
ncbi:MAG: Branched-chain-amino-acid aminotransferase [Alphaproteobacteria bacterium MarineAlpha11_Bin1]|nr:MAG: Branched-chain-amino-acid aminotransferase [Alphaproteobacteria bacterium MarineAlpha11_Bin1]